VASQYVHSSLHNAWSVLHTTPSTVVNSLIYMYWCASYTAIYWANGSLQWFYTSWTSVQHRLSYLLSVQSLSAELGIIELWLFMYQEWILIFYTSLVVDQHSTTITSSAWKVWSTWWSYHCEAFYITMKKLPITVVTNNVGKLAEASSNDCKIHLKKSPWVHCLHQATDAQYYART